MKKDTKKSLADMVDSGLAGIASMFKKGPAEKAGEKIDRAVRKTKDAIRNMADDARKNRESFLKMHDEALIFGSAGEAGADFRPGRF